MSNLYFLYEPDKNKMPETIDESIQKAIEMAERRFTHITKPYQVYVHPEIVKSVTLKSDNLKIETAKFGGSKKGVKVLLYDIDLDGEISLSG